LKVVIVEGLIGSGKTTLTRELSQELGENTLTLFEPDEKDNGNPYLGDYYADPARWAFVLQVHQLQARFRMHSLAQWHVLQGKGHAVLDRSYMGDTAFAQLQLENGLMSEREYTTYSSIYQAMTASVMLPRVCVRVLASPETCSQRVSRRMQVETGRSCESGISLEYLRGLDRAIDHVVNTLRAQGVTILEVPWDLDKASPEERLPAVRELASQIRSLPEKLSLLELHRRSV